MARGCFFVLEGIDGAGTTTQVAAVAARLRARGIAVTCTHEPSEGPIGAPLRAALRAGAAPSLRDAALALLFAADRLEHHARTVAPAQDRGEVVLCDRYVLSSLAYQGLSLDAGWVAQINAQAPAPDATWLLDVPAQVARARVRARGAPADRFDDDDMQGRLQRSYAALAAEPPAGVGPVHVLDGSAPAADVTLALQDAMLRLLQG